MTKLQFYSHNCLIDCISIQTLVFQPKGMPKHDQQPGMQGNAPPRLTNSNLT